MKCRTVIKGGIDNRCNLEGEHVIEEGELEHLEIVIDLRLEVHKSVLRMKIYIILFIYIYISRKPLTEHSNYRIGGRKRNRDVR